MFEMKERQEVIPVLCRFWREDNVWNGSCTDLPVAAFGTTFEEAQEHLGEAIVSHVQALARIGKLAETAERLRARSRDYGFMAVDEVAAYSPLVKFLVSMGANNRTPELAAG